MHTRSNSFAPLRASSFLAHRLVLGTALAALPAPLQAGPTSSFADLPGGVFVELPLGTPTGPFGPFQFPASGGGVVTATLLAEAMSCPDNIGSHGEMLTIPNDPLVDPGDHDGRFVRNTAQCPDQSITLNFSEPVLAAGVTFRHVSCGFTAQGDRTIHVFSGPGGAGTLIGTAMTEGFAFECFNTWLDFVGVVSDEANIRSMVIVSDADPTNMVGLAVSPGSAPAPDADLAGSGAVNAADLAILLGAWSIPAGTPGCAGTAPCPADLNDDGFVNAADLAILLGAWTG